MLSNKPKFEITLVKIKVNQSKTYKMYVILINNNLLLQNISHRVAYLSEYDDALKLTVVIERDERT